MTLGVARGRCADASPAKTARAAGVPCRSPPALREQPGPPFFSSERTAAQHGEETHELSFRIKSARSVYAHHHPARSGSRAVLPSMDLQARIK